MSITTHFSNNQLNFIFSKPFHKKNKKTNIPKSKSDVDIKNENLKNNVLKFDFSCNFRSRMNRQIYKNMTSSTDRKLSISKSQILNNKSIDSKLDNFCKINAFKKLFFKRQICKKQTALDQLIVINNNNEDEYEFNNKDFYFDDEDEKNNSIEKIIIENKIIYFKKRLTSQRGNMEIKKKDYTVFEDKYYAKRNQNLSKKKYHNLIRNNIKLLPNIQLNSKKKENKSFSKKDLDDLLKLNKKNYKIITNQFLNRIYKEIQNNKKGMKKINHQVNQLYNQTKFIFDNEINNFNL